MSDKLHYDKLDEADSKDPEKGTLNNIISLEQLMESLSIGKFQFFQFLLLGLACLSDGMEISVVSFLLPKLKVEWDLSDVELGVVGSLNFAFSFVGSMTFGYISDNFGRKKTLMSSLFLVFVFGLVTTFSPNYPVFVLLRSMVGFSLGGNVPVMMSLLSESSPSSYRAQILNAFSFFWVTGGLLGAGIAWAVIDNLNWRWFVAISAIPAFCCVFTSFLLSESPRYLLVDGQKEELKTVLRRVSRFNNVPLPSIDLDQLIAHEDSKKSKDNDVKGGFAQLVKPPMLKRTLSLWWIWFWICFATYGLGFFLPIFFSRVTEQRKDEFHLSSYAMIFIGLLAEYPGVFVNTYLVGKLGRKLSLTMSLLLSGIFIIGVASFSYTSEVLMLISLCLYTFSHAGSFGTLYSITPEIYPTSIRGTGVGAATSVKCVAGMLVPMVGALALEKGTLAIFLFGGAFLIGGMTAFLLPTTFALHDSFAALYEASALPDGPSLYSSFFKWRAASFYGKVGNSGESLDMAETKRVQTVLE